MSIPPFSLKVDLNGVSAESVNETDFGLSAVILIAMHESGKLVKYSRLKLTPPELYVTSATAVSRSRVLL